MAEEAGVDLVEVANTARPPVCKLMDYGKYKYEQKQKAKEAKKNATQIQVKEVQLRPKTDEHDIDFKIRHIQRFLDEGDKAKITVKFRGREITHKEQGFKLLEKVIEDVTEYGLVESAPKMEGRTMIMILAPKPRKDGRPRRKLDDEPLPPLEPILDEEDDDDEEDTPSNSTP